MQGQPGARLGGPSDLGDSVGFASKLGTAWRAPVGPLHAPAAPLPPAARAWRAQLRDECSVRPIGTLVGRHHRDRRADPAV